MKIYIDRAGKSWEMIWGIADPYKRLNSDFGVSSSLESMKDHAVFQDPNYPEETKELYIYKDARGRLVVIGEITPGVYAIGVEAPVQDLKG